MSFAFDKNLQLGTPKSFLWLISICLCMISSFLCVNSDHVSHWLLVSQCQYYTLSKGLFQMLFRGPGWILGIRFTWYKVLSILHHQYLLYILLPLFPIEGFLCYQPFCLMSVHCQRAGIEASCWGSLAVGKTRSGWQNAFEQKELSLRISFKEKFQQTHCCINSCSELCSRKNSFRESFLPQ